MKDKIEKPKEFTDAEAEAFTRYLTKTEKKKLLHKAVMETKYGLELWIRYLKYKNIWREEEASS